MVSFKTGRYVSGAGKALHRLMMEKHLGRTLLPDEVVHHKNGKRWDNRLCNLEVMERGEHSRLHHLGKKVKKSKPTYTFEQVKDQHGFSVKPDGKKMPLTPILRDVLAFIYGYEQDNGFMPTLDEIAVRFGHTFAWSHYMLRHLEQKGWIEIVPRKMRGIKLK